MRSGASVSQLFAESSVPVAARILAEACERMALAPSVTGALAAELFTASGVEGMVGGQWRDLEAEGCTLGLEELRVVHRAKTGALIEASCALGAIAARATPGRLAAVRGYGREIGLAFQVADDVLDVTGTSEELGKTAGKDAAVAKSTYVALLGIDGARVEALRLAAAAKESLRAAGIDGGALADLAGYIANRQA